MKRFAFLTAVAFLLAVAFPLTSQAQMESGSDFKVGPRASIPLNDLSDFGSSFAIGGEARYDLSGRVDYPIQLSGAFDYHFVDQQNILGQTVDASAYTIDLNGLYSFPTEGTFAPYAGAGLGIVGTSVGNTSDSDVGLNLVGGAEFEAGSVRPYLQGQFSLGGDFTRFGLSGGVLFAL